MQPIEDELKKLNQEVMSCIKCDLSLTRTHAVPGEGPFSPQVMFIGEAPGEKEDQLGRPFTGRAGAILDDLLARAGLDRDRVFITSVVKCRPPKNRDPRPREIAACKPYLDRQLELLHPRLIATLGRFAMARWFPGSKISEVHGQVLEAGRIKVVPLFHPGAALHQPGYREAMIKDMEVLAEILGSV
ncbi:MAG: uracil-DNA glycosylase [Desulfohalobiaceae bacterium]|nr:uracil-DNA glycosylase [Desulfohalobiaceae bacterium]